MSATRQISVDDLPERVRVMAREAAERDGVSLVDWLGRLIESEQASFVNRKPTMTGQNPDVSTAARLTQALDRLTQRIETSETRATLAIAGVDQSITGLASRIEAADQRGQSLAGRLHATHADFKALQDSLSQRIQRIEADDTPRQNLQALRALEQSLSRLAQHVYAREDETSSELRAATVKADNAAQLAARAAEALETSFAHTAKRVDDLIERAELRTSGGVAHVADRVAKIEKNLGGAVEGIEQSVEKITERLARAEGATNAAIKALEQSFANLDDRISRSAASSLDFDHARNLIDQRVGTLAQELKTAVVETRRDIAVELERHVRGLRPDGLERVFGEVNSRLSEADRRHSTMVESIKSELSSIAAGIDGRLRAIETRNESDAIGAFHAEAQRLGATIEARLDSIEARDANTIERIGAEVVRLADRLDQRVNDVEGRTAQAISDVGGQVASIVERLRSSNELLIKDLDTRLQRTQSQLEVKLGDALAAVDKRASAAENRTIAVMNPIQKAIAALASRLESLEDLSSPAGAGPSRQATFQNDLSDAFSQPPASTLSSTGPATTKPGAFEENITSDGQLNDFFDDVIVKEVVASSEVEDRPARSRLQMELSPSSRSDLALPPFDDALDLDEPPLKTSELPPHEIEAKPANGANDYLARARRAAIEAQLSAEAKKQPPEKVGKNAKRRAGLILTASIIAVVISGGAGAFFLRGKIFPDLVNPTRPANEQAARQLELNSANPDDVAGEGLSTTSTDGLVDPEPAGQSSSSIADQSLLDEKSALPGLTSSQISAPALPSQPATTREGAAPLLESARIDVAVSSPQPPRSNTPQLASAPPALMTAASGGDPIAQYDLAQLLIAAGRQADAASELRKAANQGLAVAQYRLAKLFEAGQGVPINPQEARRYTELAALAGNMMAMHDLAHFFIDEGVDPEGRCRQPQFAQAADWFRRAAERNLTDSQVNLGVLHESGCGVPASATEALFWFEIAAKNGDAEAVNRVAEIRKTLPASDVDAVARWVAAFKPRPPEPRANGQFGPRAWQA